MVIDGAGSTTSSIGPLRYLVLTGKSARERMRERLMRRLHEEFPLTKVVTFFSVFWGFLRVASRVISHVDCDVVVPTVNAGKRPLNDGRSKKFACARV